ncbi:siderophore-interacting protein [Pseudactinotalea sp.]|uniref:siderophore-interacting protein n=1 Tax=Pseudactinotalea sp. TaxID=1926260 RepID=UPI003B3A0BC5
MARDDSKPQRPTDGHVHELQVVGSERVSSSFVRVRLAGGEDFDASFRHVGFDQWFRLFLPNDRGGLELPSGTGDGWYKRWLAIPEVRRSLCRNYTVRQARQHEGRWELDVDFVVHAGPSGEVDGPAAAWALRASAGDRVGFLDQGMLFAPADAETAAAEGGRIWIVADETGLPGVEGVLASVNGRVPVTCLLEVPHDDDVRALPSEAGLDLRWLVRGDSHELPGQAALRGIRAARIGRSDYVYTAGEGSMALDVRKVAQRSGVRNDRIDFCAYWRPERRAA